VPRSDRIAAAIATLELEDRALLELSARRGLDDEEIAAVLGVEPAEVADRREDAVARLGDELGVSSGAGLRGLGEDLEELDDEQWRGSPAAAAPSRAPTAGRASIPAAARPSAPVAGQRGPGVASPLTQVRPGSSRRPLTIGLVALAVAVGLVIAIVLAAGGDDPKSTPAKSPDNPGAKPDEPKPNVDTAPPEVMQRLNGTYGQGTAQIFEEDGGARLRLDVSSFLQPQGGGYAVWLYNSADDARRLYATRETSIQRDIRLPKNYARYRFVEVARAVPDLDSDHSGISLLRARMDALTTGNG
jgi:hypothetical protein